MKSPKLSKSRRKTLWTVITALLCAVGLLDIARSNAQSSTPRPAQAQLTPTAFSQPALLERYQQTITPESLSARLYFLASDFFEGRETTARGQKLAAEYLASQYRQIGLAPRGTIKNVDPLSPSAYFQPFTVYRRTPRQTRLEVIVNGKRAASSDFSTDAHDDLSYFLSGSSMNSSGGVVFAGYGIADDKLGYDDYAALASRGISVDGQWVMMLEDEPLADATTSLLPTADHKPSSWTTQFINKRVALWKAGKPAGILVVSDTSPRRQGTFADDAALASVNARRIGILSLHQSSGVPQAYAISTKMANQILAPTGHKVEDLKKQINRNLRPVVFDVSGVTVKSTVEQYDGLKTENVLAFLEGSDPQLKDEVVIISSHYDHLGVNPTLKGDQTFNGAADDGSGVVASLGMAQAFMQAKRDGFGPRRSILFINFSGEEKGLLGSAYYTDTEPIIPLEKSVADINMDGIGGIDADHPTHSKNYIYVIGEDDLSQELIGINKRIKEMTRSSVELTDHTDFRSDNYHFKTQLIPFIYYSTGYTEHYHQPGDEAKTIDYSHLARVAQLIFGTAWQVANQDARPPGVKRSQLTLVGYVCPPCSFACDSAVHAHPGECPVCGMNLVPKYSVSAEQTSAKSGGK